jgi:GNAT superfamily N-acetyltransferase
MALFGQFKELRIPAGPLLRTVEHIEVIPPVEHGPKLYFQVFCNGMPIGHARLEKMERGTTSDNHIYNLLDARRCPTYSLKMIQIAQNYRNRGIGTVLLKEIMHYCKNNHIQRITGEIKGEMLALRHWYQQNGFSIINDTWLEIQLD